MGMTTPAFTRRDWWYLGGLAVVTFAYFWQAASGRGVFFHEDLHDFAYPLKAFHAEALRAHRLPMWNPYIGAGYPQFAEGQIGALYPLNVLLFGLMPLALAFNHLIIWHFALAGIFFYLFLRKRGLSAPAAFVGASIFEWSGFMASRIQNLSILPSVAWLPLLLYFLEEGRQRAQTGRSLWQPTLAGGAVVALQVLVGFPPVAFYSLLAGAIYLLCAGIGFKRAALLWGGIVAVGVSVSAVQWLPTADVLSRTNRAEMTPLQHLVFMTSYGLTPRHLATLVFPNVLGSSGFGTYVGSGENAWEVCGYLGLLALPLMVVGALRRRRWGWPFVVMGLVGLALAFGRDNPIYRVLCYVPIINSFRAAGRYLVLWTVAGSALAAVGAEALLAARAARSRRTILAEAAMVAAAAACVAVPWWFMRAWPAYPSRPAALRSEWLFLLVSLALFGAWRWAARAGGSRRLMWGCAGAAILADLLTFGAPLAPVAPVASLYGKTPWAAQRVAEDPSWHRVWAWRTIDPGPELRFLEPKPWAYGLDPYLRAQNRLTPNLPILWRLQAVQSYSAFVREIEWLTRLALIDSEPVAHQGFLHLQPLADLLGAKYLLLGYPEQGLELVERRGDLWLYRNPNALPRAWVVGAADATDDQRQETMEAMAPSFPRLERVLLNAAPPVPLTTPGAIPADITFEDPRPEVMRLHTRTDAPGMLVVSVLYDPDWQATLDGRETRLYRANHLVRAVFLPAGEHVVELRYDNLTYQLGLRVSLIMALFWTVLALRASSRRRRSGVA
jgi:hypothetical protein